ncbi:DHH family phosphoesterase [Candidatus Peregrinibacteria bacterium]|nr:DHH family phosphoesterase [Candidatus Peregrinibacteria bacterium]
MASESTKKQIVELIKKSGRILIMPSSPADGDSIGSALSLYLILKKLGKETTVAAMDPIPDIYDFLPAIGAISDKVTASKDFIITLDCSKTKIANIKSLIEDDKTNIVISPKGGRFSSKNISFNYGPEKYDLVITVDTAAVEQLGHLYEDNIDMFNQVPVINIDHHISNEQFGRVNYVDYMASSTTELLIPIIEELEKSTGQILLDDDIATLLLAGIITDTGSFQNANTTPKSFDVAAYLVAKGGRQQEIIQKIYKTKPLSTLKLWGRVLSKIQIDEKYKFVWSVVTQKDFKDTGSNEEEVGEIIDDLLSNAPGAEVVLLLKEKSAGLISGSIRTTNPSVDANEIAAIFGGGGHARAAGFKIKNADFEKVYEYVIDKIKEFQANRLNIVEENSETTAASYKYEIEHEVPLEPEIAAPAAAAEPEIETSAEAAPIEAAPDATSITQAEPSTPAESSPTKRKRGRKPKSEQTFAPAPEIPTQTTEPELKTENEITDEEAEKTAEEDSGPKYRFEE